MTEEYMQMQYLHAIAFNCYMALQILYYTEYTALQNILHKKAKKLKLPHK
jgi:hypothetical protein